MSPGIVPTTTPPIMAIKETGGMTAAGGSTGTNVIKERDVSGITGAPIVVGGTIALPIAERDFTRARAVMEDPLITALPIRGRNITRNRPGVYLFIVLWFNYLFCRTSFTIREF